MERILQAGRKIVQTLRPMPAVTHQPSSEAQGGAKIKLREETNRFLAARREIEAMHRAFPWLPEAQQITKENAPLLKQLYVDMIPLKHEPARAAQERNALVDYLTALKDPDENQRIHRLIAESDVKSGLVTSSHVRKFPDIWAGVQPEVEAFEAAYGGPIFTTTWRSYSRGAALVRRFELDREKIEGERILHISPEAELREWFSRSAQSLGSTYHTLNLGGDVDFVEDLTALDIEDGQYDWIICHRVLEHIFDDTAAIRELWRVLKANGVLNVSVPESMHVTAEDFWAIPDRSHHHHYRQYGSNFCSKLESCGFRTTLVEKALNVEIDDGTFPFRMYDAVREG